MAMLDINISLPALTGEQAIGAAVLAALVRAIGHFLTRAPTSRIKKIATFIKALAWGVAVAVCLWTFLAWTHRAPRSDFVNKTDADGAASRGGHGEPGGMPPTVENPVPAVPKHVARPSQADSDEDWNHFEPSLIEDEPPTGQETEGLASSSAGQDGASYNGWIDPQEFSVPRRRPQKAERTVGEQIQCDLARTC